MARPRKKKRTHVEALKGSKAGEIVPRSLSEPKSMVIRIGAGEVGSSVSQLAKDLRNMLEPATASRLKERRSNKLKDYTTMSGPLGVTHLLLLSRSDSGNVNLRIALTPRGPTLYFRIEQYALAKDIQGSQKKALRHFKYSSFPPLLVMNNFSSTGDGDNERKKAFARVEKLTTTVFQSLFPPILPRSATLSSIRRVLLLDREAASNPLGNLDGDYILNLRHYAISTTRAGVSRPVLRLDHRKSAGRKNPDQASTLSHLSRLGDVSDLLLEPSLTMPDLNSGTNTDLESDNEIEVSQTDATKVDGAAKSQRKLKKLANTHSSPQKRIVKLMELGPRIRMRMTKIEEGVCDGKTLWHELQHRKDQGSAAGYRETGKT